MKKPLVIIGTGLAGYNLAKEWRRLDQETPLVMITKNNGVFYSKPQLSTAFHHKKTPETLVMSTAESMEAALDATIHVYTTVMSIDLANKTLICDKVTVEYDRLVLAVGAEKRLPPLAGDGVDAIFSVNELEEFNAIYPKLSEKPHVAIVGSGLVGCEFANDWVQAGLKVDVFSVDDYPLARFAPEKIGRAMERALQEAGVQWHFNERIVQVDALEGGYGVVNDQGDRFEVDYVCTATGLQSNVALAKQLGLKTHRGICVDAQLRTSMSDIYAIGDCAEVLGQVRHFIAPLLQCARALARTLAGQATAVDYPPMPVTAKTSLCPVAICMPYSADETVPLSGQWCYDESGNDVRALYYDEHQKLQGFVLSGQCAQERMALVESLKESQRSDA